MQTTYDTIVVGLGAMGAAVYAMETLKAKVGM